MEHDEDDAKIVDTLSDLSAKISVSFGQNGQSHAYSRGQVPNVNNKPKISKSVTKSLKIRKASIAEVESSSDDEDVRHALSIDNPLQGVIEPLYKPRVVPARLEELRLLAHKAPPTRTRSGTSRPEYENRRMLQLLMEVPPFARALMPLEHRARLAAVDMMRASLCDPGDSVFRFIRASPVVTYPSPSSDCETGSKTDDPVPSSEDGTPVANEWREDKRDALRSGVLDVEMEADSESGGSDGAYSDEEMAQRVEAGKIETDVACLVLRGSCQLHLVACDFCFLQQSFSPGCNFDHSFISEGRIPFHLHEEGQEVFLDLRAGSAGTEVLRLTEGVLEAAQAAAGDRRSRRARACHVLQQKPPSCREKVDLAIIGEYLREQVPCFQGVPERALEDISMKATIVTKSATHFLCQVGNSPEGIFVLLSGSATLKPALTHPYIAGVMQDTGDGEPEEVPTNEPLVSPYTELMEDDVILEWELCMSRTGDEQCISSVIATSDCVTMLVPKGMYYMHCYSVRKEVVLREVALFTLMGAADFKFAQEALALVEAQKAAKAEADHAATVARQIANMTGKGTAEASNAIFRRCRARADTELSTLVDEGENPLWEEDDASEASEADIQAKTSSPALLRSLSTIDLFLDICGGEMRHFTRRARRQLCARAKLWRAHLGEVLYCEGDASDSLIVVISGEVGLFRQPADAVVAEEVKSEILTSLRNGALALMQQVFSKTSTHGARKGRQSEMVDEITSIMQVKALVHLTTKEEELIMSSVGETIKRYKHQIHLPKLGTAPHSDFERVFLGSHEIMSEILGDAQIPTLPGERLWDVQQLGQLCELTGAGKPLGCAAPGVEGGGAPRGHTAVALSKSVELLVLDREAVVEVLRAMRNGLPRGQHVVNVLQDRACTERTAYDLYVLDRLIRQHDAFAHLECRVRAELCRALQVVEVPSGQNLYEQGATATGLFQILQGKANAYVRRDDEGLENKAEFPILQAGEGAAFGEAALLAGGVLLDNPPAHTETVRADGDLMVAWIEQKRYIDLTRTLQSGKWAKQQALKVLKRTEPGSEIRCSRIKNIVEVLRALPDMKNHKFGELADMAKRACHVHVPEGALVIDSIANGRQASRTSEKVASAFSAAQRRARFSAGGAANVGSDATDAAVSRGKEWGDDQFPFCVVLSGCIGRYPYSQDDGSGAAFRGIMPIGTALSNATSASGLGYGIMSSEEQRQGADITTLRQELLRLEYLEERLKQRVGRKPLDVTIEVRLRLHAVRHHIKETEARLSKIEGMAHRKTVERAEDFKWNTEASSNALGPSLAEGCGSSQIDGVHDMAPCAEGGAMVNSATQRSLFAGSTAASDGDLQRFGGNAGKACAENDSFGADPAGSKQLGFQFVTELGEGQYLQDSGDSGDEADDMWTSDNMFPGIMSGCVQEYREGDSLGGWMSAISKDLTFRAHADTDLLILAKSDYDDAIRCQATDEMEKRIVLLRQFLPDEVPTWTVRKLAPHFCEEKRVKGSTLVQKGSSTTTFWIIVRGLCHYNASDKRGPGGGKMALGAALDHAPRVPVDPHSGNLNASHDLEANYNMGSVNIANASRIRGSGFGQICHADVSSQSASMPMALGVLGEGQFVGTNSALFHQPEEMTVIVVSRDIELLALTVNSKVEKLMERCFEPLRERARQLSDWHSKRYIEISALPGRAADRMEQVRGEVQKGQIPLVVDSPFLQRWESPGFEQMRTIRKHFGNTVHPESEWMFVAQEPKFFESMRLAANAGAPFTSPEMSSFTMMKSASTPRGAHANKRFRKYHELNNQYQREKSENVLSSESWGETSRCDQRQDLQRAGGNFAAARSPASAYPCTANTQVLTARNLADHTAKGATNVSECSMPRFSNIVGLSLPVKPGLMIPRASGKTQQQLEDTMDQNYLDCLLEVSRPARVTSSGVNVASRTTAGFGASSMHSDKNTQSAKGPQSFQSEAMKKRQLTAEGCAPGAMATTVAPAEAVTVGYGPSAPVGFTLPPLTSHVQREGAAEPLKAPEFRQLLREDTVDPSQQLATPSGDGNPQGPLVTQEAAKENLQVVGPPDGGGGSHAKHSNRTQKNATDAITASFRKGERKPNIQIPGEDAVETLNMVKPLTPHFPQEAAVESFKMIKTPSIGGRQPARKPGPRLPELDAADTLLVVGTPHGNGRPLASEFSRETAIEFSVGTPIKGGQSRSPVFQREDVAETLELVNIVGTPSGKRRDVAMEDLQVVGTLSGKSRPRQLRRLDSDDDRTTKDMGETISENFGSGGAAVDSPRVSLDAKTPVYERSNSTAARPRSESGSVATPRKPFKGRAKLGGSSDALTASCAAHEGVLQVGPK